MSEKNVTNLHLAGRWLASRSAWRLRNVRLSGGANFMTSVPLCRSENFQGRGKSRFVENDFPPPCPEGCPAPEAGFLYEVPGSHIDLVVAQKKPCFMSGKRQADVFPPSHQDDAPDSFTDLLGKINLAEEKL